MKIVFKSEDIAELNFERHYADGFEVEDKSLIRETVNELTYKGLHTHIHRIYCPGLIVSLIEGELESDLVYLLESDFPYLQMHFELSTVGCLYYPDARSEIDTVIYGGRHSLLFYPALKGQLNYIKKPWSQSVEIELSLDFLRGLFQDDLEVLRGFGRNIELNYPSLLGNQSFPITPAMRHLLGQIRDCPFRGTLKRLFVEAKVVELLTLQISQINAQEGNKRKLKKADIDKLNDVRDLLIKTIDTPYSIEELAKIAGINRTKLQEGFKELFGTTIFGYISDIRLEEARRQIQDEANSRTIAEIAAVSGYKNPQHFTVAFKKKYGVLPRDME